MAQGNESRVSDTIERRKLSRDWLNNNYWPEFTEVYQLYKCRVNPIYLADGKTEDTSRTNLCMPDAWIMCRRKTARLTARPPSLRIRAKDPAVADFLSDLVRYQWDRSGEGEIQSRHVLQGNIFGYSAKAHWWNQVVEARRFRRKTSDILQQYGVAVDEEGNLGLPPQGQDSAETQIRRRADGSEAPQRQIVSANRFSPEQIASVVAKFGPEVPWYDQLKKYDGPVSSFVFVGDFFPEPEAQSLHDARWVILDSMRNLDWLAWMLKQTYVHPFTGEELPAIDPKAAQELVDMGSWNKQHDASEHLKNDLRAAIFKTERNIDPKLIPGKAFLVTCEYTFRDGWPWAKWVGNEKVMLGEIPLPWDLYGRYPFSMYTPIPDLMYFVGDSSPRVLRHIIKAHNVTVDQRMDLVSNNLKPLIFKRKTADLPAEVIDRGAYRVVEVENMSDLQIPRLEYSAPPEAWEQEKQLLMQLQEAEPAMNGFGAQSQAQPGSSQVATIATLQQQAGDVLTADELKNLNMSLSQETEIKLWMYQQQIDDEIMQATRAFTKSRNEQQQKPIEVETMEGSGGYGPVEREIGPLDLQQDFEVFPEQGSTLAASDVLKRSAALQIYQIAETNPFIDKRKATEAVLQTIDGANASDLMLPPQPQQPTGPDMRVNVSVAVKFDELSDEIKAQILQSAGLEVNPDQVAADAALANLKKANEAGKQLEQLSQPVGTGEKGGEKS